MLPFQNCLSGKIRIRHSHAEKKNIKMSDLFKLNLFAVSSIFRNICLICL